MMWTPRSRTALRRGAFLCIVLGGVLTHNVLHVRFLSREITSASRRRRDRESTSVGGSRRDPSEFFNLEGEGTEEDYEVVATDYGWTTPNREKFSRRKLIGEFFAAVTSHPRYNSSAWADLERNPDPSRRIVAFLDVDTCIENNYPVYGPGYEHNLDIGPMKGEQWSSILDKSCEYIKRASNSPALRANGDSRLILLDCGDGPYYNLRDVCGPHSNSRTNGGGWGDVLNNTQVIIAYYGIKKADARPFDIGLPTPAIKPIRLRPHERFWVEECKENSRDYLFSFQGRGGFRRERLLKLDNGRDVYVRIKDQETYGSGGVRNISKAADSELDPYEEIMRNSQFAGAPRGDCLWSYRFAEIMSAGAVPVVYSNGWLPPFSSPADPDRVVDWTRCALFVNEGKGSERTLEYIGALPDGAACEMRRCALAFWDEFGSSREGWLRGLLLWVNNGRGRSKGGAVAETH